MFTLRKISTLKVLHFQTVLSAKYTKITREIIPLMRYIEPRQCNRDSGTIIRSVRYFFHVPFRVEYPGTKSEFSSINSSRVQFGPLVEQTSGNNETSSNLNVTSTGCFELKKKEKNKKKSWTAFAIRYDICLKSQIK